MRTRRLIDPRMETAGVDLEARGTDGEKYDAARAALDADVGEARWTAGVKAALLRAIERQERRT